MNLAFDLDDCLVATSEANRLAYLDAGVVIPQEARYMPGRSWGVSEESLRRKVARYPYHLKRSGRLLPAGELFQTTGGTILTGASMESAKIVCEMFDLRPMQIIGGLTPDDKIEWFWASRPGAYFDDWAWMVSNVMENTRWQAVNVSSLS